VESLHHLNDSDVRAVVDELMISVGSVGPAPCVREGVELRLAHLPARLAKEDVVIGVRVKRWIEINEIDTGIRKFSPIREPFQVVPKNRGDSFSQNVYRKVGSRATRFRRHLIEQFRLVPSCLDR